MTQKLYFGQFIFLTLSDGYNVYGDSIFIFSSSLFVKSRGREDPTACGEGA
jgi:hypothetical protein